MPPEFAIKTASTMAEADDPGEVFDVQDNLALDADEEDGPVFQSSLVLWNRCKTPRKPFKLPLRIVPSPTHRHRRRTSRGARGPRVSLFSLPLELRREIYKYALPVMPRICPHGHSAGPTCMVAPWEDCIMLQPSGGISLPCRGYTALLCTNKAIYAEAVEVLYNPVRGLAQGQDKILKLIIASEGISLRGFSLFCPRHWRYRTGAEATFAKLRYLDIDVIGERESEEEFEEYDEDMSEIGAYCNEAEIVHQLRDNVEWAVLQLQRATLLSKLNVRLLWEGLEQGFRNGYILRPSLKHCKHILRPFQTLRHISEPKILKIDPYKAKEEKWKDYGGSLTALLEQTWKRKIVEIMSSHDPVKQPGRISQAWWQFKANVKRAKAVDGSPWPADDWLIRARLAKKTGDSDEFAEILVEIEDYWQMKVAASIGCEDAATEMVTRFVYG